MNKLSFWKFLLLFFALFAYISGKSIGQTHFISDSIEWRNEIYSGIPGQPELMYFKSAVYSDTATYLPYYHNRFKLPSTEANGYQIKISQAFFEPIPVNQLPSSIIAKQISDSILLKSSVGMEKKEPFLEYSFVPLRRNPQTGKLERLKFFVLSMESNSAGRNFHTENASSFPQQSVLSNGSWFEFLVATSGIYKMTYTDIINMGISDPENVKIYGNGGKMLPEVFTGLVPNDPQEIPIMMVTGNDGVFNAGDYILFYAEGSTVWKYDNSSSTYTYEKNRYRDSTAYFITSGPGGKRISTANIPAGTPNVQVSSFDGFDYHELNTSNLIRSGREWYGEEFGTQSSYNFTFNFANLIFTEPVYLESEVLGRSTISTSFDFSQNNKSLGTTYISAVDELSTVSNYANFQKFSTSFIPGSNQITFKLTYNNLNDVSAQGWLNYLRLTVRQSLSKSTGQLRFRDNRSVGNSNLATFTVSNTPANVLVWNIDDLHNPKTMQGQNSNSTYTFKALSDSIHEYIAFDPQNDPNTPIFLENNKSKVPNQNLHNLQNKQFVIISPPEFFTQAQDLADFHTMHDNLSTVVLTTNQVYNEFSSGSPDPAAIRNFMKMLYDRASDASEFPKYLLLFGDGSYNNKTSGIIDGIKNSNYIVTYESANSLSETYSYVSDDYFGMLDDNENITTGLLDIGVGRFPVSDTTQARNAVNKIKKYYSNKAHGDWRNSICFIADAGDNNLHMQQADELATYIATNEGNFNIQKAYVDAFPAVSTSSGKRCPDGNAFIREQLNRGVLIMNYTGHGSEQGLSAEQIVRHNEDVNLWNNENYPLFITATCEISRFDDYQITTAGEDIFLNPEGGGIAMLTTTRLVYSAPNFSLNTQFYNKAFHQSPDNPYYRLGDMMRITKNNSGSDINKLNFTLLGDPALSLAMPKYNITTDSINHNTANQTDTLKAYGLVSIKGRITDETGSTLSNYNGIVYPTIFDKPRLVNTLGNYDGASFSFQLRDNVLFKGKTTVTNGEFTINCILPRDINYDYGFGKISYYSNDSTLDASGNFDQVIIGGLSTNINSLDTTGPFVKLYLNDTTFKNGGITDAFPTLLAKVSDKNGINPGGNGIGHDILAILDQDPSKTYLLNSYYETDIDNFTKGSVTYKFPQLSPGNHQLEFKIWDIFNNSAKAFLNFTVISGENLSISKVYNYPNPLVSYTNFVYEHNFDGSDQDVTIEIYNSMGSKVRELKTVINTTGYNSGPIRWEGTDGNGNKIYRGIYFYRIIVRSNNQTAISRTQKLIVIN